MTLLFSSDLHGRVGPVDPLSGQPTAGGVARVATLLREARRREPTALYLDLGDLVQGTPLSTLAARERPEQPHPLVRILNSMGCRGMVVGNHEFNFGLPFVEAMRQAADFPLLAANVLGPRGEPYFDPVLRFRQGGRTIAILALTTPQVPRWEEPWNIEGLTFRDAVETAREWVPKLRAEADAVVVAAHMGWDGVTDGGFETPLPPENDVGRLVREVDGIDAVLMAHTHRFDEQRAANGTHVVQAGSGGLGLGELTFEWAPGAARPETRYQLRRAAPYIAPAADVLELAREATERIRPRLEGVIAHASGPFTLDGLRYRDNAILSLFHRVQQKASRADLSSAVVFRGREELAAGPIRGVDLFRIYPFENDLTILELSADDVRAYLEETALAYTGPAQNGSPPPLHPMLSLYNHDMLAGCEYLIDPGKPAGTRVESLTFGGETLPGAERLTLAVTSYRAQGGGGYQALKRARVVERTGRDLRSLLVDFVREAQVLEPIVFNNWRVRGAPDPGE
ncbi:MAG: 2',3'-cyclic-nucleotide 2'-phosphodiesterase [Gemmatimonadota bacterium]|nr:MAG: 2',3'-cyclic-nucleotide 2'-phosphodiesterase [Gemmatimonadota bacterium]